LFTEQFVVFFPPPFSCTHAQTMLNKDLEDRTRDQSMWKAIEL